MEIGISHRRAGWHRAGEWWQRQEDSNLRIRESKSLALRRLAMSPYVMAGYWNYPAICRLSGCHKREEDSGLCQTRW